MKKPKKKEICKKCNCEIKEELDSESCWCGVIIKSSGSSLKEEMQPETEYQYPEWCVKCMLQETDNCSECYPTKGKSPTQYRPFKPTPKLPKKLATYLNPDGMTVEQQIRQTEFNELANTLNQLIDYLHAEEKRKSKIIEDLEEEIKELERKEP